MSLKKIMSPAEKRKLIYHLREEFGMNIRSTCSAIRVSCSVYYYDRYVIKGDTVIAEVQTNFDR